MVTWRLRMCRAVTLNRFGLRETDLRVARSPARQAPAVSFG